MELDGQQHVNLFLFRFFFHLNWFPNRIRASYERGRRRAAATNVYHSKRRKEFVEFDATNAFSVFDKIIEKCSICLQGFSGRGKRGGGGGGTNNATAYRRQQTAQTTISINLDSSTSSLRIPSIPFHKTVSFPIFAIHNLCNERIA